MSKKAPSTTQLLVITGFALSCFGILLFLWITFGGPTPFKAKSYEVTIPFDEAAQLAQQSDVRISGVNVGKVKNIERNPGKLAIATIEIDDKYAPIPKDTRAILRTKTLLAETYVELTPGSRNGPKLPDGGELAAANVAQSVQIDEIFRTFNPKTRAAFQEWMQNVAIAINGRGQDLSAAFGELGTTFTEFDQLFRTLDTQRLAVKQLFSNGAVALNAFRGREGQLADLVRNSNNVFRTTAVRDRDIEALFRAFPTFEDQSRLTLDRLKTFAQNTDPLMRQLVPAAEQLSPTLIAFSKAAPEAKGFFEGFATVIARLDHGLPGPAQAAPRRLPALPARPRPLPAQPQPDPHRPRPLQARDHGGDGQRRPPPPTPSLSARPASRSITSARSGRSARNRWRRSRAATRPTAIPPTASRSPTRSWPPACSTSTSASAAAARPPSSARKRRKTRPSTQRVEGESKELTKENTEKQALSFYERLKKYALGGQDNTANTPAPGCSAQGPFESIYGNGPATAYQHTFEQGK